MDEYNKQKNDPLPHFSIVLSVHDQATDLEQCLPLLLEQEYDGYEVVVVNENSTDDTDDILTRMKARYTHLYTTFIPKTTRYENRHRLGLSLGVKAAKHEWLIITEASMLPPSQRWLAEIAETINGHELSIGYILRKSHSFRLQTYTDVIEAQATVSKTERFGADGHAGHLLRYVRGMYDFIVVPADMGHEVLKLYGRRMSWKALLWQRLKVVTFNLLH